MVFLISVICFESIKFNELEALDKLALEIGVGLKIKFVAILGYVRLLFPKIVFHTQKYV